MPAKSKLEEVLRAIKKGTGDALVQLEKFVLQRGVKPDEVKFSLLPEQIQVWKNQGKKRIDQGDIDAFIAARNDIPIQDTSYGDKTTFTNYNPYKGEDATKGYYEKTYGIRHQQQIESRYTNSESKKLLKYFEEKEGYNYPVLNYNEAIKDPDPEVRTAAIKYSNDKWDLFSSLPKIDYKTTSIEEIDERSKTLDDLYNNYIKEHFSSDKKPITEFKTEEAPLNHDTNKPPSGHFFNPNYIAHARGVDFPDKRALFELQSDVHQQGSRFGYGPPMSNWDDKDADIARNYYDKFKESGRFPSAEDMAREYEEFGGDEGFSQLYEKYAKRYDPMNAGHLPRTPEHIENFLFGIAQSDPMYSLPVKRARDTPMKQDKWMKNTLEGEIDSAFQSGKPLYILRTMDGQLPPKSARGKSFHEKEYLPGGKIDKQLAKIAKEHGLDIEDVIEEVIDTPGKFKIEDSPTHSLVERIAAGDNDPNIVADIIENLVKNEDAPLNSAYRFNTYNKDDPELIRSAAKKLNDMGVTFEELGNMPYSEKRKRITFDEEMAYSTYQTFLKRTESMNSYLNSFKPKIKKDNYIKVTDPQNRGKLDYYQYGKLSPEMLAALGLGGGSTLAVQKFYAQKQKEQEEKQRQQPQDFMGQAAGDMSYYGTASQTAREASQTARETFTPDNIVAAGKNIGTDWLEQYYKTRNNADRMFYADDPNEFTSRMDKIREMRERNKREGTANIPYEIGSFLLGP
jgi:hypothetical protein